MNKARQDENNKVIGAVYRRNT